VSTVEEILKTVFFQNPHDRGTYQTPVAGNIYLVILIHSHSSISTTEIISFLQTGFTGSIRILFSGFPDENRKG
jgi:hypothetical protein